tara:strand:- start:12697 stop:13092 length:396 start_codon:yes stop_codon:yes gene_type:complete
MTQSEVKRRGRGRPRKAEVAAVKPGNKGKVGRPKGDAAIINEYKARMLASPKSRLVLETIFDAALDNDHKNQAAAWKLVMDRMLPIGIFEREVMKDGGRNAIQINISGVGAVDIGSDSSNEVIEGEVISEP